MKIIVLAVTSLLPLAAVAESPSKRAPERSWITDVRIISPESPDHTEKGSVFIENGHIVSVERGKNAKKPSGATVVSGDGKFLIPGLIDSHVHLAAIPGMRFEASFDPGKSRPPMIKGYLKQLPRSYLYFGYTTLIDLAVIDRQVLEDFRKAPLHPDLYDCGQSPTDTPCRLRRLEYASRSFQILFTILSKPRAFPLVTSRKITLRLAS